MLRDFQIWFLTPDGKGGAKLACWRDTGPEEVPVIIQDIEFTDFPFGGDLVEVKLYVENNTIVLPGER